jgi:hypothetical protein
MLRTVYDHALDVKLATYIRGPLEIVRRGKFKRDNGWQPITDAGSSRKKAVEYERVVGASDLVM